MRTIDEIRRENLELAISRLGGKAIALANAAGIASAYISQIRTRAPDSKSGKPKALGDEAARKIESALGEPAGWMDAHHSEQTSDPAQATRSEGVAWPFTAMRSDFDRLTPQEKATLDAVVGTFIAGCLAAQPLAGKKVIEFTGLGPSQRSKRAK